jgi:glucan phosphoethanolaminetransferase (alkaline phosphatase superfamily)
MIQPGSSVYQENPGPVTVILLLMLVAVTASTLSVLYRIVKRSPKLGVTGVVVAILVGIFCVLATLSVGPFVLPLAGLLVVLALPMSKLTEEATTPPIDQ